MISGNYFVRNPAVMDSNSSGTDFALLVDIAIKRSASVPTISRSALEGQLTAEIGTISAGREYCSGHDLAKALAVIISRRLKVTVSANAVERMMRAMFSDTELIATQFYADLKKWAADRGLVVWRYA